MTLDPVRVMTRMRTPGGDEPLLATRRFELVERIDHPFELTLELMSDDLELEVRSLLGARALVELDRPGVTARSFGGVVTRAEYVTTRNAQLMLRATVEPSLALLRHSTRRRIFSDLTLPEVLEAVAAPVFAAYGGSWDVSRVGVEMPSRDYVVQWDESDLDFVLRLLGEAGLCLLHGEGEDGEHVYMLVGKNAMFPGCAEDPSTLLVVAFEPEAEEEADEPSVQYLGRWDGLHAQGVTVRARDWKTAGATRYETRIELGDDPGRVGHAWTYHPGRLDEGKGSDGPHHNETEAWATRLLDEQRAGAVEVTGASNVADFFAGSTFELQGHPHADLDQRYALLSVVHQADFPEVEAGHDEAAPTYTNRFVVTPLDAGPVRPPLRSKPNVSGIESATVVGPQGEEVHTDARGRVRVRFHWDEVSGTHEGQTCWLRVLSPWAGPGYGASFIPRVGMEVVVGFLGGDPDRPVVTGCLYTGTNVPPGALPETKTQTVLRTQSTPGGEGFNELRFEDAVGREEVYLHAQRNQRSVVRAAQSTRVGASRSLSVGKDSQRSIGGSETVQVGTLNAEHKGELQVFVTGGELRKIGDVHALETTSAFWTADEAIVANAVERVCWSCTPGSQALDRPPSGGSVLTLEPKRATLEALESIELRVGETSLRLTPKGIEMQGELITANAQRQMWLAAPAGRVSLSTKGAEVFGGPKSESLLRLRAPQAELKARGMVKHAGASVVTTGTDLVRIEGATATVTGRTSVGITSAAIDLHADGLVDVKGQPINLNC
ncbi:MAG: type VI secretion system Vgr family protein [Nannocystaceae bacterium]|nr:type VI secretion system tip protein VgrG [bacterium]